MVTVKIKGTACCLYNVYTVVTTSHGITSLALAVISQLGNYPTAGQLYHGRVQGVSVHGTSHLYYSIIMVYLNCALRRTFKPLGFASWFKCPPLMSNSSKPL